MKSIGILASHNGSGFKALYKGFLEKELDLKPNIVISNNSNAMVLKSAHEYGIDSYIVNSAKFENPDQKIYELFQSYQCDFVFLSGYMKKLPAIITENFTVINAHPSLLPKYGGVGMYGKYVHEAVINNQEKRSGITIHHVNENYDEGEFVLQKELILDTKETVQSLEKKVKALEQKAIIEAFLKLTS